MKTFRKYRVWAEYGPTAHDVIGPMPLKAKSAENARKHMAKLVKRSVPHLWNKIGMMNIHAQEMN